MAKESRFNFVIESDLLEKAKILAAAQGISVSELFCRLLAAYADRNSDVIQEYQEATQRMQGRLLERL